MVESKVSEAGGVGDELAMLFEQRLGLHHRDDAAQELAEGFAFFGQPFAFDILKPPVR